MGFKILFQGPEAEVPSLPDGHTMRLYTEEDFSLVLDYDSDVYLQNHREAFLKQYLHPQSTTTFLVCDRNSKVVGYGCIQSVDSGLSSYLIAPLYADTTSIAETLLGKLLTIPPKGTNVGFDVYEDNKSAVQLAKMYELAVFEEVVTVFMCKVDYEETPRKAYAITSACICLI